MLRNDTKSEKVRSALEKVTCHLEPDLYGNLQLPEEEPKTTTSPNHDQHSRKHAKQHHYNFAERNPHRTSDDFDDTVESEDQYDEETYEDTQQDSIADSYNSVYGKKSHTHLFQIPINMLPCPEELRDSTDAPLSRLSQGEIKDFRHSNSAVIRSNLLYILLSIVLLVRMA